MTYLDHINRASVVGARSANQFLAIVRNDLEQSAHDATKVSTLVGGGVGFLYGQSRGHGVLGAIAGASLGRNLPSLTNASERKHALLNIGETGFAVAVSAASKRHPIMGFVLGKLVASAVTYFTGLRGE